jgi:hypothetical protein
MINLRSSNFTSEIAGICGRGNSLGLISGTSSFFVGDGGSLIHGKTITNRIRTVACLWLKLSTSTTH